MSDTLKILLALIGSVVTLGLFVISVTFKMGHHAARIESLEKWRDNIRLDMHEISDKISNVSDKITGLTTMIEERTERRVKERHNT